MPPIVGARFGLSTQSYDIVVPIQRWRRFALPPDIQTQRDNLTIGLYLAHTRFGATLDDILQVALGYSPGSGRPVEYFENRFRNAQRVGRDYFRSRTPGYFTFNAMPFGGRYIYKATWYIWINPNTHEPQTVPLPVGDLASMRRLRSQDLSTRESTTRSVRAADNVEEQRQAILRQNWAALQSIHARMIDDGSLGEILSGFHGLPYADIQEVIDQLPTRSMLFQFQRDAKIVRQHERRLTRAYAKLGQQLTRWVMLQTGVPSNAPQAALQQAQQRLASL